MKLNKIKIFLLTIVSLFTFAVSAQNIFEKSKYDSIYFQSENFVIAKQKKSFLLVNKNGETQNLHKFITIAELLPNVAYQIVLGDKLKMINGEGNFIDNINTHLAIGVCGTVRKYRNSIFVSNDSTFIKLHTTYPWADPKANDEDILAESNDAYFVNKKVDLYFLNGTKDFHFTGNDFYQKGLESNIYIEKLKNEKINLLKVQKIDSSIKVTYLIKEVEVVEKSKAYIPKINHQPFIFKKENKYGYYPLQITTKYKSLSVFDRNFAAFILPNGKKGWLDRNGKEFFY